MTKDKRKRICILGSDGQIGAPLTKYFKDQGHKVLRVDIKKGEAEDLAIPNKDVEYWIEMADYVIFLAFDVGGSKYLAAQQDSFDFINNNVNIMSNVFQMLKKHDKPFLFASSMMVSKMEESTYGLLKRLGEVWTQSCDKGLSVRFWNIYGPEELGEKSHVITDFVDQIRTHDCLSLLSTGTEARDFLHVDDCARAIDKIMQNHDDFDRQQEIHLCSGRMTTINELAFIVRNIHWHRTDRLVPVTRGTAKFFTHNVPEHLPEWDKQLASDFWSPKITLQSGVKKMFDAHNDMGLQRILERLKKA